MSSFGWLVRQECKRFFDLWQAKFCKFFLLERVGQILVIMLLRIFAARFVFDEDAVGPEEVGRISCRPCRGGLRPLSLLGFGGHRPPLQLNPIAPSQAFRNAEVEGGAGFDRATGAEGAKEMVKERLRFALVVAAQGTGKTSKLAQGFRQLAGTSYSVASTPSRKGITLL
jgi:hypothetical protein